MPSDSLIVDISHGGSYAPGMAYYRICNEREHQRAMAHVAAMGGPEPEDEYGRDDNVLLSYEDAEYLLEQNRPRRVAEWRDGWDVSIRLDRWTAFAYYGYDAGDTLGV